jgi:hypothetical protein
MGLKCQKIVPIVKDVERLQKFLFRMIHLLRIMRPLALITITLSLQFIVGLWGLYSWKSSRTTPKTITADNPIPQKSDLISPSVKTSSQFLDLRLREAFEEFAQDKIKYCRGLRNFEKISTIAKFTLDTCATTVFPNPTPTDRQIANTNPYCQRPDLPTGIDEQLRDAEYIHQLNLKKIMEKWGPRVLDFTFCNQETKQP